MRVLTFGPRIDIGNGPVFGAPSVLPWAQETVDGPPGVALDERSEDTPREKARRGGRPAREAMTLTGLRQLFLLHCEVERQLSRAR
jgi:hypothetical protein